METETPADAESTGHRDGASLESILEALLVDDAELMWDPNTGKPMVTRRPKPDLDSPARSE